MLVHVVIVLVVEQVSSQIDVDFSSEDEDEQD